MVKLEEAKTGDRYAVLPSRAELLIRRLPAVGEYVFPAGPKGAAPHLTSNGMAGAWRKIRRDAGLEGDAGHAGNSRKTYTSVGNALGIGDDMLRILTGHSAAGSHGVYLRITPEHRQHADRIAETIAERLGLPPKDNILQMVPRGA
jgi:hypothetical protein